jgi:hypothetical protein
MPCSGTKDFNRPDRYQANFPDAELELHFTGQGSFKARLTQVELQHIRLLKAQENLPRIAFLSLEPERIHVAFSLNAIFHPVWTGLALQSRDIVFHSRGGCTHDRTSTANCWGYISITQHRLMDLGRSVTGAEIVVPQVGCVLRPPSKAATRLRRLHGTACRLAETRPEMLAHEEVARSLENELLHALVNCLDVKRTRENIEARRRRVEVMAKFERALAITENLGVPELCEFIGVPERTFRTYCAEFIGMSPNTYLQLRQPRHRSREAANFLPG